MSFSRRNLFRRGLLAAAALAVHPPSRADAADDEKVARETLGFIRRCARDDGGYAPSPDPAYKGRSDTSLSDLAGVTYAAVLAKTMGWELPRPGRSVDFIHKHQQPDGRFVNLGGGMDPKDPLAVLYNTTQGVVALRALGAKPNVDPAPVMDPFFENDGHKKLPWYTTSFFPLFYAALGRPFPAAYERAIAGHMEANQKDDGYIQNHVASSFHAAHFYRVIGKPTPKARAMVDRTIKDQKPDGGWNIFEPDWDVHACFDALYILRQLGGDAPQVTKAIDKGAGWAMSCRNPDGGFGHFPSEHSDMDAVYFQFGSLVQAGRIPGVRTDLPDAHTIGWGHAMQPGKNYA